MCQGQSAKKNEDGHLTFSTISFREICTSTPPKTNMEPNNECLEYESSFQRIDFQVPAVCFRGVAGAFKDC